jgi:hypothetical protein
MSFGAGKSIPQGLKPALFLQVFMYGLKPVPFKISPYFRAFLKARTLQNIALFQSFPESPYPSKHRLIQSFPEALTYQSCPVIQPLIDPARKQ